MCGIAGMVGLPNIAQEKMLLTMRRRGPDGQGVYTNPFVTLLHSRLAIIDPDNGSQPMALQWGNERYVISYNGELYNTEQLRRELIKLGHSFLTHSDTEVLIHAYAQWQEACLDKLNGIFAFAVWQENEKKLFLARDPMGVKPLFYMPHAGGLLFASEIKTILAYPTVTPRLDTEGVGQILLLGPGRTPGSGVFKDIYELEPGWCGIYQDGKLLSKQYWKLTDREHTETFEETCELVRYLVTDAISRQMVSDVPIGTFLSGGLDSSLISAVCAKEVAEKGQRLPTFSLDYENNERYFVPGKFQPTSDNDYIRIMCQELGCLQNWTVLTRDDLVNALADATRARDLPGMADVDFSLLCFCKNIRQQVKVAQSGECADEIFGGYPWFRDPQVRAQSGFPWAQNTCKRAALLSGAYKAMDAESFVNDRYLQTISQCDILPGTDPENRRMKEMVNLNYRWFMQTLLDRKDRMSMYCGLEVRVPFCDKRIAQYLYGVPWAFKDYQGREKGLLRQAMDGVLPEAVAKRKKSPYPKTYDPAYAEAMRSRLNDLMDDKHAPIWQMVDKNALKLLVCEDSPWPWYGQLMGTAQTMAYMLQIDFWLREYRVCLI